MQLVHWWTPVVREGRTVGQITRSRFSTVGQMSEISTVGLDYEDSIYGADGRPEHVVTDLN